MDSLSKPFPHARLALLAAGMIGLLLVGLASPGRADDDLLKREHLGKLRLDLSQAALQGVLGRPARRSREMLEAATGSYVETWDYPSLGLSLKLGGEKKGGAKKVESITAQAPCRLQTARGIRIGSPEAEVRKAYAAEISAQESGPGSIVVGSIYGGVIFQVKSGRVTSIFMGAAAE